MHISTVLGVVAAMFGTMMALSPLLQAKVIRTNRSSRDVSIAAMWMYVVNSFGWLAYGISIHNIPMIVPNIIALASLSIAITVAVRHRAQAPTEPEMAASTSM